MKKQIFFLIAAFLILSLYFSAGCREGGSGKLPVTDYVPGEIIVKFTDDAFNVNGDLVSESIKTLNAKFGLIEMKQLFDSVYIMKFPVDSDVSQLMRTYINDPFVAYAEPNYIVHAVKENAD